MAINPESLLHEDHDWLLMKQLYVPQPRATLNLVPDLQNALENALTLTKDPNMQDVSMNLLQTLLSLRPGLTTAELVRAFNLVSMDSILNRFTHWSRTATSGGGAKATLLTSTRWVSDRDMDWAEDIGLFGPTGEFEEDGTYEDAEFILSPRISKEIVRKFPTGKESTAREVAFTTLQAIAATRPDFDPKQLARAFAVITNFIRLQSFPEWVRPFIPNQGRRGIA